MERKDFFKSAGALVVPSLFGFNTVTETSKLDITQNEIYEYIDPHYDRSNANSYDFAEWLFCRLMYETSVIIGNENRIIINHENKTYFFQFNITLMDLLAFGKGPAAFGYRPDKHVYPDIIVLKSFLMVEPHGYIMLNEDLLCKNLKMKKINIKEVRKSFGGKVPYFDLHGTGDSNDLLIYKFDKPLSILI